MTQRHTDMTFAPPDMADMAVLYQQYAPAIFAYLTQHMPHEEDAEDILVEVFLAALENAQFSEMPEKAQLAWLWRVARNKTIDVYRRSTRRGHSVTVESITESVAADDDAGPEHSALLREEYDVLQGHLKGLSPLQPIANGIIYVVQRTGVVYAYNATTGGQLWSFDSGRNAWATTSQGNGSLLDPSSVQVANGIAYFSIVDRVYALNAQSGKELWAHNFHNALDINQSPAIANGTLYLTAFVPGYGSVMHPETYIYAFDAQTGAQKWVTAKMRGYLNGPVAYSGNVYVSSYDGVWYTLNLANGAIESQKTLSGGGYGDPVLINGVLYALTESDTNNTLAVLNADGSVKWSVRVAGQYPVLDDVQGGIIYLSGRSSGVYAYSATDGKLLWHYEGYLPQPQGQLSVTIVP